MSISKNDPKNVTVATCAHREVVGEVEENNLLNVQDGKCYRSQVGSRTFSVLIKNAYDGMQPTNPEGNVTYPFFNIIWVKYLCS